MEFRNVPAGGTYSFQSMYNSLMDWERKVGVAREIEMHEARQRQVRVMRV